MSTYQIVMAVLALVQVCSLAVVALSLARVDRARRDMRKAQGEACDKFARHLLEASAKMEATLRRYDSHRNGRQAEHHSSEYRLSRG